jgi:hypothetical protein
MNVTEESMCARRHAPIPNVRPNRSRLRTLLLLAGVLAVAQPAGAGPGLVGPDRRAAAAEQDSLPALVRRMDRYLRQNEVDGVTMDWRYQVSPSEEIRQSVVCQLLGYVELRALSDLPRLRREVTDHADFLIGRLEEIRSHTPFDGMLAQSLLAAYASTADQRFLDVGTRVTRDLLAIPTGECVLNGGLMVAMATAMFAQLTGDSVADRKTRDILAQLVPFQNDDGSFPHWCFGSRDIHYTGWMSMELIHLARMVDDPHIAPILGRTTAFLGGRVAPDGHSVYEQPCPGGPGCTSYYYSRATGCGYDYDTRGWTVEPAYMALALDHASAPQAPIVTQFLRSLERGGTFPDLYGYWPPPEDPEYPWTIADTSVVNMSIIFWALATELTDRVRRGIAVDLVLDDDDVPAPPPPAPEPRPVTVAPNPAPGACKVTFTLAEPSEVRVEFFDAGGRRVRFIDTGPLALGPHAVDWDGRDLDGRAVPSGVYFAKFAAGALETTRRFVIVQ